MRSLGGGARNRLSEVRKTIRGKFFTSKLLNQSKQAGHNQRCLSRHMGEHLLFGIMLTNHPANGKASKMCIHWVANSLVVFFVIAPNKESVGELGWRGGEFRKVPAFQRRSSVATEYHSLQTRPAFTRSFTASRRKMAKYTSGGSVFPPWLREGLFSIDKDMQRRENNTRKAYLRARSVSTCQCASHL